MLRNNLGRIMVDRQIKAAELAAQTGVSQQTISTVRKNPRAVVKTDLVEKLCRALNITHVEFFSWEPGEESQTPAAA